MTESTIESSAEVVGVVEEVPIQVLHVDDEVGFLKAAKQILEMQGAFQVDTASSVDEALEKMKQKTYDAIVSDYVMPEKGALEFLKELRQKGNTIPFVIFTGKGREEVAIEALNLGADHYINKIGDPETVYYELAHGIRQAVERKRVDVEVWRREERLRAVLASSPDIISVSDLQGKIVDCNEAAWKLMGFSSKEELLGKNTFEFIAEKDRERAMENLKKTLEEGTVSNIEYTLLKRDGEEYTGELSANILKDSSGNPIGFVGVVRDITERKKTEDKISKQNQFLTNVLESLTLPFYVIDANDYTIKMANSTAGFGTSSEKSTCYGFTHKRKKPCSAEHPCPLENVKKTKKPAVAEHIHYDKDGNKRNVEVHGYPILDNDGNVVQMIEYCLDITERKKAEQKLRDARKKWVSLTENTDDIIIIVDGKGVIQYVNITIPPHTPEGTIGKLVYDYVPKEQHDVMKESMTKVFKTGNPDSFEVSSNLPKIGTMWFRTKVVPIRHDKEIPSVILISTDITKRMKMQEALRESEEKYRSMVELAPAAIVTMDLKGVITSCNAFTTLSGYSKDEIIGKHFSKIGWLQIKDLPKYLKMFSSIVRGKMPEPFEVSYRRRDGEPRKGQVYVGLLKKNGRPIGLQSILMDTTEMKKKERAVQESQQKFRQLFVGNPEAAVYVDPGFHVLDVNPRFAELFGYSLDEVKGKHINDLVVPKDKVKEATLLDKKAKQGHAYHDTVRKRKDGSLVSVSISAAPIIVEGKFTGSLAIYKDISQLKKTERKMEETLEKLHVVGGLTRHDVRNKLSAVTGNIYLAKQKLVDHAVLGHLGEAESLIGQIKGILDFSSIYEKLGAEELVYTNMEKVFDEAVSLLAGLHGMKVVNDCHGLTVLADSLLRQLFYNLLHNSLRHGGKVTQIRVFHEDSNEDHLKLVYEDDGVGIHKAEKEKIFREGYGKDTGYGLYLIRKICAVYGWTIRETCKHGKGARFVITIPKRLVSF